MSMLHRVAKVLSVKVRVVWEHTGGGGASRDKAGVVSGTGEISVVRWLHLSNRTKPACSK